MQTFGIDIDYISKVQEKQRQARKVDLKENKFWLDSITSHYFHGLDPNKILEFEAPLKTIKENIKKGYFESLIKDYLLENNHKIMVTLLPEKGLTEKR